jgi:hypothetical protein
MNHRIVKALSHKEVNNIMTEIRKRHSLVTGRGIKYVDMSYDFRTNEVWRFVIPSFFSEPKEFTVTNRVDNGKHDNLYDEIMEYLNVAI